MKHKQYKRFLNKNDGEVLMNIRPSATKNPMAVIEEKVINRTNDDANKIIQ